MIVEIRAKKLVVMVALVSAPVLVVLMVTAVSINQGLTMCEPLCLVLYIGTLTTCGSGTVVSVPFHQRKGNPENGSPLSKVLNKGW